jgi:hypothetical protein
MRQRPSQAVMRRLGVQAWLISDDPASGWPVTPERSSPIPWRCGREASGEPNADQPGRLLELTEMRERTVCQCLCHPGLDEVAALRVRPALKPGSTESAESS